MNLAPIALFVYKRPDHTRRVLQALRSNTLAGESELIIFSDAPRNSEHDEGVAAVRTLVRQIDGFKSVRLVERERNLGLASSIEDGVKMLCDEQGKVIVVEDDLILSPYFLSFLNRALERYEDESHVMQISGYMYPSTQVDAYGTLFLPLVTCWGWGTWKRAWKYYDAQASGFARLQYDAALREQFNLGGAYDYYHMLEQQVRGEIDSWAIRWLLSVFLENGLVLYPKQTLVKNIGVDGSGTHGAGVASLQSGEITSDNRYLQPHFPEKIETDFQAMERVQKTLRALNPGIVTRLVRKLLG
jgi:hypothetical protein